MCLRRNACLRTCPVMEALLARSELSRMLPYLGAVSLSSATSSPLPYGYKQLLHLMYAETSIFVPIFFNTVVCFLYVVPFYRRLC